MSHLASGTPLVDLSDIVVTEGFQSESDTTVTSGVVHCRALPITDPLLRRKSISLA